MGMPVANTWESQLSRLSGRIGLGIGEHGMGDGVNTSVTCIVTTLERHSSLTLLRERVLMVFVKPETPENKLRRIFGGEILAEPSPPRNSTPLFQLSVSMPEFAAEVIRVLTERDEAALTHQVAELWVYDRCRCGGSDCATIHTAASGAFNYGRGVGGGISDTTLMAIDISSDEHIVRIETLGYARFRERLTELIP
jgi:hypothetical protein